jgi:hypothetical protein
VILRRLAFSFASSMTGNAPLSVRVDFNKS